MDILCVNQRFTAYLESRARPIVTSDLNDKLHRMAGAATPALLPELLDHRAVCCVDGRKKEKVIAVPGGSAGLFVLMLAALERFRSPRLNATQVDEILEAYLQAFGRFYMHTDRMSVEQARSRLNGAAESDRRSDGEGEPASWPLHPPDDLRAELLDALMVPDAVGCGHLRMMLEHPEEYRVRGELVRDFLRAFYLRLWDGDDRLVLDILEGVHVEQALVRVHVSPTETSRDAVVLMPPSDDEVDVFVYHPEAAAFMQVENAFFLAELGWIDVDEVAGFAEMQNSLGAEQLEATARYLAAGLPICDATFAVRPESRASRDRAGASPAD